MRDAAGLTALLVAAVVVVLAPVAWAIRESWRPELTIGLVAGAVLCAVLVAASLPIMAWRGTMPGRRHEAEVYKVLDGSLKLAHRAQQQLPAPTPAAMPWWQVAEPEHIDVTQGGDRT